LTAFQWQEIVRFFIQGHIESNNYCTLSRIIFFFLRFSCFSDILNKNCGPSCCSHDSLCIPHNLRMQIPEPCISNPPLRGNEPGHSPSIVCVGSFHPAFLESDGLISAEFPTGYLTFHYLLFQPWDYGFSDVFKHSCARKQLSKGF